MATEHDPLVREREIARLVRELELAETFELQLRQAIIDVRDQLAMGNAAQALSMLNEVLRNFDAATDVVAQAPARRS